jgi:hypothetical protein
MIQHLAAHGQIFDALVLAHVYFFTKLCCIHPERFLRLDLFKKKRDNLEQFFVASRFFRLDFRLWSLLGGLCRLEHHALLGSSVGLVALIAYSHRLLWWGPVGPSAPLRHQFLLLLNHFEFFSLSWIIFGLLFELFDSQFHSLFLFLLLFFALFQLLLSLLVLFLLFFHSLGLLSPSCFALYHRTLVI